MSVLLPVPRALLLLLVCWLVGPAMASDSAATSSSPSTAAVSAPRPAVRWMNDYRHAVDKAQAERKMLLIFFANAEGDSVRQWFQSQCDSLEPQLREPYVWLRLPRSAEILINGKSQRLLDHPAFAHMHGRQGVAILDYAHPEESYYGQAVTMLPFDRRRYYTAHAVRTLVQLPPGRLTQRSMIFAVRIHPEAPRSTRGQSHEVLLAEARSHSSNQASRGVQGHHNWDSRFHRINARLGGGVPAREVVAESWPDQTLMDACVDCVDSWRQSSGHWSAVRSYHPCYGYDIRRGRNGIWYATGIFGGR